MAHSLEQLGQVKEIQGKNDEAESLYKDALAMYEKVLGTGHHPDVDSLVQRYGGLLQKMGHKTEAGELLSKHHSEIAAKPDAVSPK